MTDDFGKPASGPLRWLQQPLVQSQDAQPQEQARAPDDGADPAPEPARPAKDGRDAGLAPPGDFDNDDSAPIAADVGEEPGATHDLAAETLAAPPVRWLRVRHETSYRYDSDVEGALHLAHLRPRDTATQQVRMWSLVVSPHPDAGVDLASGIRETVDPWGNARQVFAHSQVHDELDVISSFEAGISVPESPAPGTSQPWRDVARDLRLYAGASAHATGVNWTPDERRAERAVFEAAEFALDSALAPRAQALADWARPAAEAHRSEERRVGKECA